MRGNDQEKEAELFLYGSMEERIPADHPLRAVRRLVDAVLRSMSREFDGLYAKHGRPSIPPERLLRALLLQVFFSIRSERLLMEQIEYNLLFRWFVGMDSCERAWNHAVFSKNRQRLLNQELAQSFFTRVKEQAAGRPPTPPPVPSRAPAILVATTGKTAKTRRIASRLPRKGPTSTSS
jgi:transposase